MSVEQDPVEALAPNDKMARALVALLELSKALSSEVDLDSLLRVIVENASSVVEADRTSIFVYDSSRERLWSRVAQGLDSEVIELPVGVGIAGDVAKTRALANIRDVYADPRFNPAVDQRTGYRTRSIICVPVMTSDGRLLGVIQSVNKLTSDHFDDGDESLMRAIASHVAVAIERARLTEVYLQNERLEQALRLANEIQMRMLPRGSAASTNGTFELHAHLRAAREVGGDLYDFFWDNNRLYFCIGDVSGKGVGAALVMAVTKTLFRANAALQDDPATVLEAMSARLYEETDPSMFVTAFCGYLDLSNGRLRFANAGHDRPILLSAQPPYAIESKPGLPLGVFPSFKYVTTETTISKGDALFLYTDGVSEATRNGEELFGMERVYEILASCGTGQPDLVVGTMLSALDRFVEGGEQADDITMMCIQFGGPR